MKPNLGEITAVAMSKKVIAAAYSSEVIHIWNIDTNQKLGAIPHPALQIWFARENPQLYFLTPAQTLHCYQLESLENEFEDWTEVVAFAPGPGSAYALCTMDKVEVKDAMGKTKTFPDVKQSEISHLAFSDNGKFIIAGCAEGRIQIWDLTTEAVHEVCQGLEGSPISLFRNDLLALIGPTGNIEIWRVNATDIRNSRREAELPLQVDTKTQFLFTAQPDFFILKSQRDTLHLFACPNQYQEVARISYPGAHIASDSSLLISGKHSIEVANVPVLSRMGIESGEGYAQRLQSRWGSPNKPVTWSSQDCHEAKFESCTGRP